ncbi:MAG: hypothetical protein HOV78_11630 [Hamadaea sp.]|nr:hypothetical protein [Hamadaea sp.]
MTTLGPNAGTAHITVKPSLRGWSAEVRRQLEREMKGLPPMQLPAPDSRTSRRSGEKSGDDFAGGFDRMVRKRIQASLSNLPKADIGVAKTQAEQEIKDLRAQLETLSKKRIGIDVDAAGALQQLRDVQLRLERLSAESVDINVKADTVLASAQLAALHHQVNELDRDSVNVDVNTSAAQRGLSALADVGGMLSTRMQLLAGVGLLLIPVVAVVASLGATLVATLAAAGGGIGALLAAVLGNILPVIKAQSELKQKQQEAASSAQAYASAQDQVRTATEGVASAEISAARSISDAQRAVADARRSAARAIVSAEEAVVSAQRSRKSAQQDLDAAIDAARKKLADYSAQLRQAALDESGAALSVTQAQENLNQVLSDPTATQLQIDQARQALAEAQFSYGQASKHRKDLQAQAKKDRAAGVSGDQAVIAARQRLADANRSVADAERNLAQARADGARSVATAERNLSRARADGARQVAQAREQLAHAREAEAYAAAKNAKAQAEVEKRLKLLRGPAAVFVKALAGAKRAWKEFLKAVAPDAFGLAAGGLRMFSRMLPKLEPLVRGSARAVGSLFRSFGKFVTGKEGRGFIRWLTKTAPSAIRTIGRSVGNIMVGIGGLIGALAQSDTGFLDLTKRFADWGKSASGKSSVQGFIQYAKDNAPIVADLIRAIAGATVEILPPLAKVGTFLLKTMILGLRTASFTRKAISTAWHAIGRVTSAVWDGPGGVKAIVHGFWWLLQHTLIPTVQFLWRHVIKPVFGWIGDKVETVWKRVLKPTFQALWAILHDVVIPVVQRLWDKVVKPVFGWIGDKISGTWHDHIRPALTAFRDFIGDTLVPAIKRGIDRIGTIFDGLRKAAGTPVKFVVDTVYNNGIRKVINAIPGVSGVDPIDTSKWPSFATGGVLPGYTPGRDVHRFVSPTAGVLNLSGGEGILIPQAVRQLGGSAGIAYLNKRARAGRLSLSPLLEQSHASGGIVYVDGEPMSRVAAAQLAAAENASGIPMRVIQGSYQPYTSYSGSSHMGGGVMDTSPATWTAQSWLRKAAFAAWVRNVPGAAFAGSGAHIHSVSMIDPAVTNHSQVLSYQMGGDGLGGADYGPRPAVDPTIMKAVRTLLGGGLSFGSPTVSGTHSGGGNPLTKFLDAIDTVKDVASALPKMLGRLGSMGPWGKLMLTGVKSMGGKFRGWVNDKIPGPGPFPNLFDSGGLAVGRGLLAKETIAPERVLDPRQTVAFEQLVAALTGTDRAGRSLAGGSRTPDLRVQRVRLIDWDKGLAEIEYLAHGAAEQVYASHSAHAARMNDLDVDY